SQQNEEVVVKQFQEKYLNIKYIKIEQRETVYQAWNRGIKASSGKYITNANTDDRHRADALEIMADELDSNPDIALVYGDQFVTKIENETFDNHTEYGRFLWPEFDRIQLIHTSCCGPQPMWRRSLHDEFGYFLEDLKVAGDYEWWLRISEKYHLKHIDDVLGLYLISDGSIEHKETDACILETRKIREYYARKTGLRGLDYNTYSPTFLKINKNGLHDAALPLVSVIIPTYNRPQYLRQSIQSVLNQTYTNLEVLIINDAGCDVKSIVDEIGDKRVSYICHENNKGLAAARNTGIRNAKGKYIAYLDDDDIYYPHHISTLVNFLEAGPYRIAYTDAYRAIQELQNGKYVTVEKDIPFSRSFSRDMLLYLNIAPVQCFMHEKSICNELGLFDETLPAHEDWEYWLRLSRKNDFMHLTVLTSEFRQRTDYTNMTTTRHLGFYSSYRKVIHKYYFNSLGKSEIQNTQLKILNNFRRNAQNSGSLKKVANNIKVSIVIPVFNKVELTKKCLESLYENTPEELDFEVIIVDNASTDGTRQYLGFAQQCFSSLTYITNSENAGFAKANNLGISRSRGKYIVCLNNDTEPQPGWLEALVQIAENDKSVAAVGSKLLFPNGTIQHAGVIVAQKLNPDVEDEKFMPTHIHYGLSGDLPEAGFAKTYQVLTAASLLIRKDAFLQVGGFDEQYWNGYEDVDLCFKLSSKGWKLVYQPESIVIHHESQSGPERFSKNKENVRLLLSRWMGKIKPDYLINDKNKGILAGNGKIGLYTPPLENMPLSQNDNTKAKGPFVSIIVLTFNGLKYNKEFINSVLKFTKCPYELIVVDNASKDGTVEYLGKLGEKHPNIHVIYNEINLGFPAAVNQAIKAAAGNFVLVANNDIVVTENWLERMVEIGLSEPKIGIVGTISNAVSGVQIDKNAKYKTMPEMHRYAKKVRKENAGRYLEFPRVAFLCTLIKKEVINALGGLDERFSPGNFEDDDFCLRAEKAGYKAIIAKDVFIHHYGSKSFKADGERKYAKRIETNKKKFVNKWGATIEEIWLEGKPVRERSLSYPIHSDEFLEKYERALVHFSDEEFELAEGALKRALEIYETEGRSDRLKEYANILDLYGNLYLLSEDPEKAKDFFERELKLEPESVSACLGLGEVFFAAELFHESKEMFQWAAKNGPVNKSAAAGLAKVNRKLGLADDDNSLIIENETRMNDAAGSSKSNIVNMDIKMNELLHKAEELIGQNKLDEAIELLYEVIRTDAKNVDALNDLAVVSILAGDFESAADFIGKAVKIDPSNDVAIENMNYLSRLIDEKMNQTENNSEIHLQENLTEDVKPAGRYADLLEKAETLIENNDLASARKVLETVLMMEEGNLDAMNDLSVIEIMEKNYPAAVELLERVIRLEPDNEVANENIQYLQKELNNL
ncbi:MAG: glycosyltransferase, partial [Ignavibacteria bacterium]|nr:glycosyltransferase [Ignavibacteria bacterium]MCU7500882.1 glycosyltransferase [Ignavibacteria bacterium]MCU7514407.1 glycosyltransferase [Ignavibacteria bacterium]